MLEELKEQCRQAAYEKEACVYPKRIIAMAPCDAEASLEHRQQYALTSSRRRSVTMQWSAALWDNNGPDVAPNSVRQARMRVSALLSTSSFVKLLRKQWWTNVQKSENRT